VTCLISQVKCCTFLPHPLSELENTKMGHVIAAREVDLRSRERPKPLCTHFHPAQKHPRNARGNVIGQRTGYHL